ncbi:MAG TPA: DNA double-strand break repair nuclease NurA [Candidatus Diapherotrites archaeon]|uniref:DNA double-strand break repair nuclease NurA n=1 Tax=Candidatus Iainarchaeum sp. TaxID=3101447 RepID=A0A7J4IZV5_9ARCH|nr:DNA double-strand break repair nuclease NurA [Candidatus Diapherotrites archaeon]
MDINSVINETVNVINASEQRRKVCVECFLPLKNSDLPCACNGAPEGRLSFPVQRWVPDCLIGGVDSGFVAKRLATIDLVLVRAVGVVFDYQNGIVASTKYYPSYFRYPEPYISGASLEADEIEQSKSLLRLREEVRVSKKIIETYSPRYCFIDGSIVPQYQDKPRKESSLAGNYSDIIAEFESLYSTAEKYNCTLISTVEDSRGSRFRQILQEDVLAGNPVIEKGRLEGIFDSAFLDFFLEVGERSCAFTYTKDINQHPVLQDFNSKWAKSIYGLYVKPSQLDRPLRVEFISHFGLKEKADEVAAVAYALSCLHREYVYPSILIEADLRAKLRNDEIDLVYNKIMDKLGQGVKMRMRRENRPF